MKYLLNIIFIASLFLASCQQAEEIPSDLKGKKTYLKTKQAELRELQKKIEKLETEIESIDPEAKKEKPRTLVTTQTVSRSDFNRYIQLQAAVEAEDMVAVSSETGGRITSLNVKEGQYIKRGQLIATTDLETVKKQMAELDKSLELAVEVFNRQKRLWDQNIGSEIQFLQAKNNKERLEKNIETIQFQLTKGNVYAPKSGVIEMIIAKAGEMSAPGSPIAQILNTNQVKIAANVPEKFLRNVRQGEMMAIEIPALEMKTKGKVTMLGRTINPANRTFKVEVNLTNPKGLLKPNLLANMLLNDFSAKNVITVPLELVQQEVSGKDYVFVKKDGKDGAIASKVYVKTSESYDGNIIIQDGLQGGEELIVTGARSIADNALIEIQKSNDQ
ncbi:MAG: efflux RND transporter periplasmic adaptor subunit [Saprospiraceae bacterium]|nr:efflux RND transporter periplasmic adaptor subunit [Saprospiraceae bacterium]MDG2419285.1 efflux RND transporter periplasmic adaptor subunit [Saprospiraceae bacterium]